MGGVVLAVGLLTAWLGWEQVLHRFASLWQGTADNRSHVWARAWGLVQQFPLTGVGAGGYSAAELATRAAHDGSYVSVSAHNEYLEAQIEGGLLRFALTVGLADGSNRRCDATISPDGRSAPPRLRLWVERGCDPQYRRIRHSRPECGHRGRGGGGLFRWKGDAGEKTGVRRQE